MKTKEEVLLEEINKTGVVDMFYLLTENDKAKANRELLYNAMETYAEQFYLTQLSERIYQGNVRSGFWDNRLHAIELADKMNDPELRKHIKQATVSQMLMLVVSELSEALEILRSNGPFKPNQSDLTDLMRTTDEDLFKKRFKEQFKETFFMEIIDAIYRLLDICAGFGMNVDLLLEAKYRYNQSRPFKHNKNF